MYFNRFVGVSVSSDDETCALPFAQKQASVEFFLLPGACTAPGGSIVYRSSV